MGNFQPISRQDARSSGMSILVDRYERICMTAEFKAMLQLRGNDDIFLYFDEAERRIGIATKGAPDHVPHIADRRGYIKCSRFIELCGIDTSDGSVKFHYEGLERGTIHVFRQAGIKTPTRFRQERNGNLNRVTD